MDQEKFGRLTRALVTAGPRRGPLGASAGGVLAIVLG